MQKRPHHFLSPAPRINFEGDEVEQANDKKAQGEEPVQGTDERLVGQIDSGQEPVQTDKDEIQDEHFYPI